MTERLYYDDAYLSRFEAAVVECDGGTVWLDRTAFYPTSGGQANDTGLIGEARVLDVIDEGERIAHRVDKAVGAGPVECAIDWTRRFDHMQQHTGQHLLSAVFAGLHGAVTVSVHFGADISTIELEGAAVTREQIESAETAANEIVFENRPVTVCYQEGSVGLRKESSREGTLRVVTIADLDRSACGGTHVRGTAEVGPIAIGKTEKIRGNLRMEFRCGHRAIAAWKSETAALDAAQRVAAAKLASAQKQLSKLTAEMARMRGRELYAATEADGRGRRVALQAVDGGIDEAVRAEAHAFTEAPGAMYVAVAGATVLVASSGEAANAMLKPHLDAQGGRGGGNGRVAQGTFASPEAAQSVAAVLTSS
ncbi:MAG: alanyl-tRNA editing protein [Bryobacteraceae bacterium]